MNKYLWLAVTADQYELPIYIEDTAKELAKKLNIHTCNVISEASTGRVRKRTGVRILKINYYDIEEFLSLE